MPLAIWPITPEAPIVTIRPTRTEIPLNASVCEEAQQPAYQDQATRQQRRQKSGQQRIQDITEAAYPQPSQKPDLFEIEIQRQNRSFRLIPGLE